MWNEQYFSSKAALWVTVPTNTRTGQHWDLFAYTQWFWENRIK